MQIAVIGGGACDDEVAGKAYRIGRILAENGHIVLCGGLGGVMEAACRGAREAGGTTVGILPGERAEANRHVSIAVATGMGHARNAILVKSADAVVALPGEHGTLSEIALALKMGRPVICLDAWEVPGVIRARSVEEVSEVLEGIARERKEIYI